VRGVEFQQASDETLTVRRRRSPRAAIGPCAALAVWIAVLVLIGPTSLYGMIILGVGAGFLPWVLPKLSAAFRTFEITLSNEQGTVMVDHEALEAARVETRVVTTFFTQDPKGYSLSLWVLFAQGGSRDVELGRFRTLLEVSQASWTIEAFLAMASIKSKDRSSAVR
jgi:hypothetical protein